MLDDVFFWVKIYLGENEAKRKPCLYMAFKFQGGFMKKSKIHMIIS